MVPEARSEETAARYNANSPAGTQDGTVADARFPTLWETRDRDGLRRD